MRRGIAAAAGGGGGGVAEWDRVVWSTTTDGGSKGGGQAAVVGGTPATNAGGLQQQQQQKAVATALSNGLVTPSAAGAKGNNGGGCASSLHDQVSAALAARLKNHHEPPSSAKAVPANGGRIDTGMVSVPAGLVSGEPTPHPSPSKLPLPSLLSTHASAMSGVLGAPAHAPSSSTAMGAAMARIHQQQELGQWEGSGLDADDVLAVQRESGDVVLDQFVNGACGNTTALCLLPSAARCSLFSPPTPPTLSLSSYPPTLSLSLSLLTRFIGDALHTKEVG